MTFDSVNGSRGAAGLGSCVVVDMQLKQAPFAHHRGQLGDVGYGPQRTCLLSHGAMRGGTSDVVAFEAQQSHLFA